MNGKAICAAMVAAALLAGTAAGQSKGPKLYRWVDKQGKVHYDQALPPEAVNGARTEFSAKDGIAVGQVDRALTAEERAALAKAAADAQAAAVIADERKHQEDVMLETYSNENDLRRSYGERLNLLKTTLESTEVSIRNVRENLAAMLAQASDTELGGRKIDDSRLASIRELHLESLKQQDFQVARRIELDSLNAEFARVLNRYRQLKAAAEAPPPTPAAAPLPSASTAPGG
ncbi:MAG: DUF4124 domain-containing protein [Arenimonas sp.]